ncbi:hypothetical protein MKW92_020397, partial [Papaver armeniacum]
NSYHKSLHMENVVSTLAEIQWEQLKTRRGSSRGSTSRVHQPSGFLAFLDGTDAEESDCFVCVVIHNTDGPGCSGVHVVASIDHVNTALLWHKKMVHTQFNWFEGVFLPLILACSGIAQNAKTAAIVLQ